jgi:hypothetical protein
MDIILPTLATAATAFCVWLIVQIIKRSGSWKKWIFGPNAVRLRIRILVSTGLVLIGAILVLLRIDRPVPESADFRQLDDLKIDPAVADPAKAFTSRTSLLWPNSGKLVAVGDSHGGFHGDGEFHVVLDVQPDEIDRLLNSNPPWGQAWQRGPIPMEIGTHCDFGTQGVHVAQSFSSLDFPPQAPKYVGDQRLVNLFISEDVFFAANERCCPTLRWHNGSLLAVDQRNNRIWLSVWDF